MACVCECDSTRFIHFTLCVRNSDESKGDIDQISTGHLLQQRVTAWHADAIVQCAAKKVSPKVLCNFLSNRSEFLHEILHIYYSLIIT